MSVPSMTGRITRHEPRHGAWVAVSTNTCRMCSPWHGPPTAQRSRRERQEDDHQLRQRCRNQRGRFPLSDTQQIGISPRMCTGDVLAHRSSEWMRGLADVEAPSPDPGCRDPHGDRSPHGPCQQVRRCCERNHRLAGMRADAPVAQRRRGTQRVDGRWHPSPGFKVAAVRPAAAP